MALFFFLLTGAYQRTRSVPNINKIEVAIKQRTQARDMYTTCNYRTDRRLTRRRIKNNTIIIYKSYVHVIIS